MDSEKLDIVEPFGRRRPRLGGETRPIDCQPYRGQDGKMAGKHKPSGGSRTEQQKTSIRLDPDLHRRLRILAIEQDTTFGDLVETAIREFLDREGKSRRRKG